MLLTIEEFLKRRPDMEVHMESAIQSAINSSFILLDGECAGLISKVQSYMESVEIIDPNNEYYRNDFELSQLIEALTSQTQYSLNLGNDYSIGGGSYSIGNINSSFNRPEGRDIVAPGVYKLLSNARVYNLNVGIGVSQKQDYYLEGIDSADKHISISKAQADFVHKYQPNAEVGNVAYVNESKMVDFAKPQDLQIGTYNTNRIAGGEGHRNNYYEIDNVPDIAFFGPNDSGTYSAIQRGEVKQILNENYLTKDQVFKVVYASGIEWNSRLNYEKNWITQFVVNGVLKWYLALENNTNKQPNLHPGIWKELTTQEIDLNLIQQQLEPFINQKVSQEVAQQILDTINNLPTIEYVEETKEQVLLFNSEQDFTNFKNLTNTTDRDYETLPFQTQNDNYVTLNTTQTITGNKTFNANVVISSNPTPLVLKANNNDKTYLLIKSSDNTTNLSLGANSNETSFEVNRGNLIVKTLQNNKNVLFENVARIKMNRSILEVGTEINAGYGGGVVKFIPEDNSTKTLQFFNSAPTDTRRFNLKINEPIEATNPATKQYVDNQISNIQIPTNVTTTNTNQTISGEKTFSSLVTITKTNGALAFKPGTNQPAYFEFYNGNTRIGYFGKGSSGNNNMTLGAQSGKIVLEASQGIEIPEPTAANNPTTKNYVDNLNNSQATQISELNVWSSDIDNKVRLFENEITILQENINNIIQKRDYVFSSQNSTPDLYGETYQYTLVITDLQETMVTGVNVNFKNQSNASAKARYWNVSWTTTWGPKIYIKLFVDKYLYNNFGGTDLKLDFSNLSVRVFYSPKHSARETEKVYQGEVINSPEIIGGK